MHTIRFQAISTLTTKVVTDEKTGDCDFKDQRCNIELKVHPGEIADLYLDGANEPTEDGCIAFIRTTVAALCVAIVGMRANHWWDDKDILEEVIKDLRDRIQDDGKLYTRIPPPGGLMG
jgi:acetylornithine deacetylase/succinyl-diaminopimelate desuccinylase-like protein